MPSASANTDSAARMVRGHHQEGEGCLLSPKSWATGLFQQNTSKCRLIYKPILWNPLNAFILSIVNVKLLLLQRK